MSRRSGPCGRHLGLPAGMGGATRFDRVLESRVGESARKKRQVRRSGRSGLRAGESGRERVLELDGLLEAVGFEASRRQGTRSRCGCLVGWGVEVRAGRTPMDRSSRAECPTVPCTFLFEEYDR